MNYKIEVQEVGKYIEYLKKFKKDLERDLVQFDKDLKDAHNHWDDNNYTLTIEAKEKVATEQKKLIEYCLRRLEDAHKSAYREVQRDSKVHAVLGAAAGILVVIIFI